ADGPAHLLPRSAGEPRRSMAGAAGAVVRFAGPARPDAGQRPRRVPRRRPPLPSGAARGRAAPGGLKIEDRTGRFRDEGPRDADAEPTSHAAAPPRRAGRSTALDPRPSILDPHFS